MQSISFWYSLSQVRFRSTHNNTIYNISKWTFIFDLVLVRLGSIINNINNGNIYSIHNNNNNIIDNNIINDKSLTTWPTLPTLTILATITALITLAMKRSFISIGNIIDYTIITSSIITTITSLTTLQHHRPHLGIKILLVDKNRRPRLLIARHVTR